VPRPVPRRRGPVPLPGEPEQVRHQFERPFVFDPPAVQAMFGLAPSPCGGGLAALVVWWRDRERERPNPRVPWQRE
jgi:hypothetical protein